ncbi:ESX secretion-associated protein EspG [Allokutzneria sp. A3M-2-11 16]|uniref:ESX secretion-associated protein EspG n=1 Tax=Allokutzneria sp. A3M-2-11 16 TaxID=2962043 RepID=UPI0020B7FEC6|nr:ESX secretion-associated protein EspG [Allokutzneria sp. A3M-2-11 16]MCP3800376.1 ESX secretion-associated protein EspG [Allokutzneria sp. A3M-2-11 16]
MDVRLTGVELDVLWESACLGELPLVLDVPSPGTTHAERAEIVRRTWAELTERGVPTAAVQGWLRTLAIGRRALELRAWLDGEVRALFSSEGDNAVLAVLSHGGCALRSLPPADPAGRMVAVLPEAPAGRGVSVSVPIASFEAAGRSYRGTDIAEALIRDGLPSTDARVLVSMCEGVTRRGQFCATWRTSHGSRERAARVVGFHDNDSGRYLTLKRGDYLTVAPADSVVLARELNDLFAGT